MKIQLKELVGRFFKLNLLIRATVQELTTDIDLHFGQLPVLEYLIKHEQCTQKELADQLQVTPASIAISTRRMQKAGLLEKTVAADNLRCKQLTVTPKGRELAWQCRAKFNEIDQKMFAGFSEAELVQLGDYLDRLIRNITNEMASDLSMYTIPALKQKIECKGRKTARSREGKNYD